MILRISTQIPAKSKSSRRRHQAKDEEVYYSNLIYLRMGFSASKDLGFDASLYSSDEISEEEVLSIRQAFLNLQLDFDNHLS